MIKKVATWGTFDLLHDSHKEFLRKAKELGDYLAVIVVPDEAVYENKKRYTSNNQEVRAAMLRELPYVNEVCIDSLSTGLESILVIKPDIFAFGHDQNTRWEEQLKEYLTNKGITPEYVRMGGCGGIHTSDILK